MRKHSVGSRLVSMLLVFAMALSFVPASAFAAYYHEVDIGDIANEYIADNGVTYDYTGKTGLKGNIDTSDTISWPIRIYDYLNDGMLFEYPNASYVGDIPDGQGGAYGGGTPAPHFTGAKNVIGIDYTTSGAYGEYAYANWLSQKYSAKDSSVETVKTKVEAVNFKDPMHLQVYYPTQQSDRSKSHVWISDFANDNQKYYSKEDIRYVVVVYRTNDVYAQSQSYRDSDDVTWNDKTYGPGTIQFHWAVSDSKRDSDYDYHVSYGNSSLVSPGGTRLIDISDLGDNLVSKGTISGPSITLPVSTDKWSYMVYDMCDPNVDSDVKAKWNTQTTVNGNSMDTIGAERIAGVKMTIPINDQGEEIDISHIAYFGTKFEAEQFGKDAVAFDNDPGEYLDSHVEYTSRPIVTPVAKPSVTNNGMDFTSIGSGGYNVDTYKKWSTAQYGNSYLGYANGVKVKEVNNDPRSYVSIGNDNTTGGRSLYIWQYADGGSKTALRYITIVYKTTNFTSNQDVSFYLKNGDGGANLYTNGVSGTAASTRITLAKSEGVWTYITYDLAQIANGDSDYYAYKHATEIGFYLPTCLTGSANSNRSLDIAFTMLQGTSLAQAKSFGQQAADYMNGKTVTSSGNSYTTAQKKWNTGNNVAYSLLYANQGGGWGSVAGGESTQENGYFSYQIGARPWSSDSATETNNDRQTAKSKGYTVADDIYLLNSWQMVSGSAEYYDMKSLDLGYTLYNKLYSGVMTAGLLESGITTVTANGRTYRVPQYKEETIEYIAYLLRDSLCVGQTDSKGNYNYNFVQGTPNGAQYGYDANGNAYDLASALRAELGINLPTNGNCTSGYASVGDYATMTDAQKKALIGPYMSCKDNINTFVDAAYYLLMNLYIDNSYNQAQDEYKYLVLSSATLESNNKKAYVFDGGFTTGKASETANTDAYRNSSKSATVYDKNKQSIYQSTATSKDKIYFSGASTTTRFPFLPITDSEGVYAGETKSPYFLDDGNGVMGVTEEGATFVNRNYNYAIASNGEFIYYEEDALFFDFEGDDDVYLFINGELVVDVGAAHSVTTVSMNVKDYVDWANGVLSNLSGYDPNMSNRELENLLETMNLSDEKKAEYLRAHRLNLQDGEICQFDFYYMERHGWGANCRIASNIRVTEPAMRVEKHAYQGGDEIAYSDVIVASDPVEYNFKMINNGSSKLFNLTFTDSTIGVTLDYTNGLTVADGFNGVYVFDANGGTLEASDITALVTGWMPVESGGTHIKDIDGNYVEDANGTHVYTSIENTFKTQQELKNFLASLQGEGLDNTELDTTFLQSGYGLWVDADVTFKGIYYKLSVEQVEVGVLDNTVYVTATSMPKPNASGNQILQSQARHRVYITGLPYYYQWAGHNLYLPMDDIMADAIEAAKDSGNQAHEYSYKWGFRDFVAYINELNALLNNKGYTMRMYNDFMGSTSYNASNYSFADNIEILYWDSPFNPSSKTASNHTEPVSHYVDKGMTLYNCIQTHTYYALRITSDGSDARSAYNRQWTFYRATEENIYNEWYPANISEIGDYSEDVPDVPDANLGGAYYLIWCDYACVSTEAEIWNGVYDKTTQNTGEFYSLLDRMWSNTVKMWNWDINQTVSYADYAALRAKFGYFPGYSSCSAPARLPEAVTPTKAYRADHSALKAAISLKLPREDYTSKSYISYNLAYEKALEVDANNASTEEEIAEAIYALHMAKNQLVLKTAVLTVHCKTTVNGSERLIKTLYYPLVVNDYRFHIPSMTGYIYTSCDGGNFTPLTTQDGSGFVTGRSNGSDVVTIWYQNTPDTTSLNYMIRNAVPEKGDYTDSSWSAYQSALNNALKFSVNNNVTQADIDRVMSDLEAAQTGLAIDCTHTEIYSIERLSHVARLNKQVALRIITTPDVTTIDVTSPSGKESLTRCVGKIQTMTNSETVKIWLIYFPADEVGNFTYTITAGTATQTVDITVQ